MKLTSQQKAFADKIKPIAERFTQEIGSALLAAMTNSQKSANFGFVADRQVGGRAKSAKGGAPAKKVQTSGDAASTPVPPFRKSRAGSAKKADAYSSRSGADRLQLHAWIAVNPGARSEQMPGSSTKAASLKSLVASGHLRSAGKARGTSYFVTKKVLKPE